MVAEEKDQKGYRIDKKQYNSLVKSISCIENNLKIIIGKESDIIKRVKEIDKYISIKGKSKEIEKTAREKAEEIIKCSPSKFSMKYKDLKHKSGVNDKDPNKYKEEKKYLKN